VSRVGAQNKRQKNGCTQLAFRPLPASKPGEELFTAAGRKSPRNATILIARDHSLKWNETGSPDSGFGVLCLGSGSIGSGRRRSSFLAGSGVIAVICATNAVCDAGSAAIIVAAA
jgi:hypothetical protein